ncbi:MOSC domain-containing protein [Whalleya microplaca]|nr:MOSC domain-containing protein [Whalleya microplaca]
MKITELYIYPIKSLRPVSVRTAQLRREGLRHDRRFMLLKDAGDGRGYKNIQTAYFPECTLFAQAIDGDDIVVTYRVPNPPLTPATPEQATALRVPLHPALDGGEQTVDIDLFGSATTALRMGDPYDAWFSACLGYRAILVYIGDARRDVLAHVPKERAAAGKSWLSSITSYVGGGRAEEDDGKGGLAFNEAAPFLVTSKASLRDVSARLPEGESMDMIKFRPNIVVDGDYDDSDGESSSGSSSAGGGSGGDELSLRAWDEDFWGELLVRHTHRLALTANCGRCISINIDYETGRPASGEQGTVLKKLMKDRRVDGGNKWSPIFGRYAFLLPPSSQGATDDYELVADVAVGDDIKVTKRISERDVWAWPM